MPKLKVTQIGNSLGVMLPKRVAARLKVAKNNYLTYTETANGIVLITCDQEFEKKLKVARKITRRYRNAIKELAK